MSRFKTEKGSALLIVLVVLLLIMILFSMVVLYGNYHQINAIHDIGDTKAFYLAESGIEAALARLNKDKEIRFTFSDNVENMGSFTVDIRPFGAYQLCTSVGKSNTQSKTVTCLIGARNGGKFLNALNLGGQDYPLMLAGRTRIVGDILVSPSGVLPGRFKGQNYSGDVLVDGEIKQSPLDRMPTYDDKIIRNFITNVNDRASVEPTIFDAGFVLDDHSCSQINGDSNLLFKVNLTVSLEDNVIDLSNKFIKVKGNLIVGNKSKLRGCGVIDVDGDIRMSEDCYLKDMVLLAKRDTFIKGKAMFGGQIIASGKVEITQDAVLTGFGTIINIGPANDRDRCVYIESVQDSKGIIICDIITKNAPNPGQNREIKSIDLASNSQFSGVIYNTGYSKISGNVTGNVSTAYLYLYEAPTVYIDWLVNSTIIKGEEIKTIPAVFAGETGYAKAVNF
jgi:hypothetical protein